jgi:phage tail-like protein
MAQTGQRVDPFGNFDFLVEIDGIARAAFSEVSGLDSSIDITEYREGGDNQTMRKLPSKTKYSNITLKWGCAPDHDLYDWHQQWIKGDPGATRRNGSIVLLDRRGQEQMRWNFVKAWPAKWTGPSLSAKSNDVAIETLELAHEGLERA